jgi:hypothetical protein
MSSIPVSLNLIHLAIDKRSAADVRCQECDGRLTLHQPDVNLADRFVGTCPRCQAWYLINLEMGVMLLLPNEADLRNA